MRSLNIVTSVLLLTGLGPSAASAQEVPVQGKRNKDGKLVIHIFETRERPVPVPLNTEFGFMLLNAGTEKRPVPVFKLASNRDSRVSVFTSLPEFTNALAVLPSGTILHRYDKCLVPTAWALDTNILMNIERFCENRGISITNAPLVTCTCQNKL